MYKNKVGDYVAKPLWFTRKNLWAQKWDILLFPIHLFNVVVGSILLYNNPSLIETHVMLMEYHNEFLFSKLWFYFVVILAVCLVIGFVWKIPNTAERFKIHHKDNKVKKYKKKVYLEREYEIELYTTEFIDFLSNIKLPKNACVCVDKEYLGFDLFNKHSHQARSIELHFETEKDFTFWLMTIDSKVIDHLTYS